MKIEVNGEEREIAPDLTIRQLLMELGIDPETRGMAVALDREVVFRQDWGEQELKEGSAVEIVRAVAGG